ncbi:geranylgeranyl reductase family protein [Novosphingobium kunmingense]|uniref:Geranylgeranyl reductase family protein n=1 Tax=Novosphingobium kunmingense TaxID=1211806 RepID=A0A2N0H354_9SPHN|nr:geranylgeranyl reductase family protein [Novosphingobium kunmingense]PKB13349.1 geranylgeranyl reductase family protein [Novosphingobium kunmingense]
MVGATGTLWDAIVVGAGQAGAAAAYDLAARGRGVLVVERQPFPRVKPCAGGVTVKALQRLRFSIHPVVRCVVRDLALSADGGPPRKVSGRDPVMVTTVRAELDTFCLDQARARGAAFLDCVGDRLVAVEQYVDRAVLRYASGQTIAARFVVAADGANSTIRRLLGLATTARAFALEGHVPVPDANRRATAFDFGAVAGGYGWVFPKGDHVNIGLYTQSPATALSRDALRAYARAAIGSDALEAVVGHPMGVDGHGSIRRIGRILLAGDAAGTCERLLGEGIHNAIASGQAAASAILSAHDDPCAAGRVLQAEMAMIDGDLLACSRAAERFYAGRRRRGAALAVRPVTSAFRSGFAAGMTVRAIAGAAALYPFFPIRPVPTVVAHEAASARP